MCVRRSILSTLVLLSGLLSMDQMQCSDHPAAGIYEGMFWSDMQGVAFPGFALLSQDGQFAAYSDGGLTGFGGSATLQANGSVSGLDELGCHYNGNVTIPDQQFNLFKVTITISTCPGFNGVYQGLGTQIDWFTLDDGRGLRVLVSSGQFAFLLFLTR